MKSRHFMGVAFYVIGITIIGVCDILNDGVRKREIAQDIRSDRLERNQIKVQERVIRQQEKMLSDMKRRQAKL